MIRLTNFINSNILAIDYHRIDTSAPKSSTRVNLFNINDKSLFSSLPTAKTNFFNNCFNKSVNYFLNDTGRAGHAAWRATVHFDTIANSLVDNPGKNTVTKEVLTAYHTKENEGRIHLANGGASTSETHARFFELMYYHAKLNGDTRPFTAAYNYARLFLMPGDGWGSRQLPNFPKDKNYSQFRRFMHWAYQISPGELPSAGYIFPNGRSYNPSRYVKEKMMVQDNTPFKIYDRANLVFPHPCIALGTDGYPDFSQRWEGDNPSYKFAVAPDADSWLASTLFKAQREGFGDFREDISGYQQDFKFIMGSPKYPGAIYFGSCWGGNIRENWGGNWWIGKELYIGYQNPLLHIIFNQPAQINNMLRFAEDAQKEFHSRTRIVGPFMPVYTEENKLNQFTWEGYDMNTHWLTFQARFIDNLVEAFEETKDPAVKNRSRRIIDKYFSWLGVNIVQNTNKDILLPYAIFTPNIEKLGATHPGRVFLNEFKDQNHRNPQLGEIIRWRFSPTMYALTAQALLKMAKITRENKYLTFGELILKELAKNQESDGSIRSIDNNEDIQGLHYGFINAEAGIAFAHYRDLK